jgi:hypothetical protein
MSALLAIALFAVVAVCAQLELRDAMTPTKPTNLGAWIEAEIRKQGHEANNRLRGVAP